MNYIGRYIKQIVMEINMKDKIFMSHSSFDKGYIEPIAHMLGRDLCIYDKMCFEEGMKTFDEILKGLDSTSLFVFFISEKSLESDWVKRELIEAENKVFDSQSKLEQVYPIIIDESIDYRDKRIPDFLKNRFRAYNIQHIHSNKVAGRKILSQYTKLLLENQHNIKLGYSYNIFCGRKIEMNEFQIAYEEGQPICCFVVAGISGIGKKSFIVNTLRDAQVIERYYEPPIISLSGDDGIIDLIMKLVELGFGDYTLEQIVKIGDISSKINILSNQIEEIQNSKEHIIIYDDKVIIGYDGEPKYWFNKALENVRKELVISLASSLTLKQTFLSKNKRYLEVDLTTLKKPEWKKLLRVYGDSLGVLFEQEDRDFFNDIITGYPPQVIFCADYAKQYGIEFVKKNGVDIVASVSGNISKILNAAFSSVKGNKEKGQSFLTFMSNYGLVPMKTILDIFDLNEIYRDYFYHFKSLTICRLVGAKGDYVEINPAIADFVQRKRFEVDEEINTYLEEKVSNFESDLDTDESLDNIDFESLKLYLKKCIKDNIVIKKQLLYSTIYISSVRELYNNGKYDQVIEIIKNLKNNNSFDRFDIEISEQLQQYFCRALARQFKQEQFYEEIEWFKKNKENNPSKYDGHYHFLRGFMFRLKGEYDKAVNEYLKLVNYNQFNRAARKEIVSAYLGMEEYDICRQYAEYNFKHDPSNRYYVKDYLDSIFHSSKKYSKNDIELKNVKEALDSLYLFDDKDEFYFELNAKYAFYVEKNMNKSMEYLREGKDSSYDTPYLSLTEFDIMEKIGDVEGMKRVLDDLKQYLDKRNDTRTELAYKRRCLICDAYSGADLGALNSEVIRLKGLSEQAKERLKNRLKQISRKKK